jgi:hypothetical protein
MAKNNADTWVSRLSRAYAAFDEMGSQREQRAALQWLSDRLEWEWFHQLKPPIPPELPDAD